MQAVGSMIQDIQERINRLRVERPDGSIDQPEATYDCPQCKDEGGTIKRDKDGVERWVFCECWKQKQTKRLFKSSQITQEFQKLTFQGFVTNGRPEVVEEAFLAAKHYFMNFRDIREKRENSIALLGEPGSGKTHLLMALSNNLIKRGVRVQYFPWVEGYNDLKNNLDLLDEKIYQMQTVPVLFIDDLFKGRREATNFQIEQLFAVVNYRYLNHLPILVSSEKDIDEICEIDMGIGSRIYEMCKDYTVVLKGVPGLNYRIRELEDAYVPNMQ